MGVCLPERVRLMEGPERKEDPPELILWSSMRAGDYPLSSGR